MDRGVSQATVNGVWGCKETTEQHIHTHTYTHTHKGKLLPKMVCQFLTPSVQKPCVLSNFLISSNLVILVILKFHLLFCPLNQSLSSVSSFILSQLLLSLHNCSAMILVSAFVVSCTASQKCSFHSLPLLPHNLLIHSQKDLKSIRYFSFP